MPSGIAKRFTGFANETPWFPVTARSDRRYVGQAGEPVGTSAAKDGADPASRTGFVCPGRGRVRVWSPPMPCRRAVAALEGLNDPARIADHALDGRFDAGVARREIEAALAAHDADLAQSFVDLAADRSVAIDPAQVQKVNAATAEAATTRHKAESFARGFITGEPDDMAALAGTTLGDLFVFGDIRDALREGKHLVAWRAGR